VRRSVHGNLDTADRSQKTQDEDILKAEQLTLKEKCNTGCCTDVTSEETNDINVDRIDLGVLG
jgi:hypothetical protein